MRKITLFTVLICIGLLSFGQSSEEEKIKKTIEAEAAAINKGDFQAFATTWQQTPDVTFSFFSSGVHNSKKGWDSLAVMMQRRFKNPNRNNSEKVTFDNYIIKTNGNMAWVQYNENLPASDGPYPVKTNSSYRIMLKDNEQWKTTSYIITQPETYAVNNTRIESDINTSGYNFISQKKINEAIEVFKLNVKLFPDAWNTYDSLGEAYAIAGNKKLAIENYEKSIKLNPKSVTGSEALVQLKK